MLPEFFLANVIFILFIGSLYILNFRKGQFKPLPHSLGINFSILTILRHPLFIFQAIPEYSAFNAQIVSNNFILYSKIFITLLALFYIIMIAPYFQFLKVITFEIYVLILITLLASLLLVGVNDFLMFYLVFELQSYSTYLLAASKKDSLQSLEAGLKYFIQGSVSSGFLLLGISFIYGVLGSLNFKELRCYYYARPFPYLFNTVPNFFVNTFVYIV